jgi:hypothetical protein
MLELGTKPRVYYLPPKNRLFPFEDNTEPKTNLVYGSIQTLQNSKLSLDQIGTRPIQLLLGLNIGFHIWMAILSGALMACLYAYYFSFAMD